MESSPNQHRIIKAFLNVSSKFYLRILGDEMTRRDLSSVDSLDGLCPSSGPASTDDDSLSLCSEFEPKPQKLETRIGINHFNRYMYKIF